MLDENWAEMIIFSYEITKKNNLCFLYFCYYYWKYFYFKLIPSLLIQKFKYIKYKKNKYPDLTVPETEWLKLQIIIMKYNPIRIYCFR